MRGHTAGKSYRRDEVVPYVDIWKQPVLRWVWSNIYHFWEKHTEWAMRPISRWHRKLFERWGGLDYIPLVNRRDIKCFHYSERKRTRLTTIYITDEQYDIITGKTVPEEKPRRKVDQEPITEPQE